MPCPARCLSNQELCCPIARWDGPCSPCTAPLAHQPRPAPPTPRAPAARGRHAALQVPGARLPGRHPRQDAGHRQAHRGAFGTGWFGLHWLSCCVLRVLCFVPPAADHCLSPLADHCLSARPAPQVSFTWPGASKKQLSDVSCRVSLASRVAVLGANGAGKSTLIKLLTGEKLRWALRGASGRRRCWVTAAPASASCTPLAHPHPVPPSRAGETLPEEGQVWKHPNLRLAYVAQHAFHHVEQHLEYTPSQYIWWRCVPAGACGVVSQWGAAAVRRGTLPAALRPVTSVSPAQFCLPPPPCLRLPASLPAPQVRRRRRQGAAGEGDGEADGRGGGGAHRRHRLGQARRRLPQLTVGGVGGLARLSPAAARHAVLPSVCSAPAAEPAAGVGGRGPAAARQMLPSVDSCVGPGPWFRIRAPALPRPDALAAPPRPACAAAQPPARPPACLPQAHGAQGV